MAYLINLVHFFTPLRFLFINKFFEKYLNFWVFLSVFHLVENYAKIVDNRGRNFMCNRTLPSLLVDLNRYRAIRNTQCTQIIFIDCHFFNKKFKENCLSILDITTKVLCIYAKYIMRVFNPNHIADNTLTVCQKVLKFWP